MKKPLFVRPNAIPEEGTKEFEAAVDELTDMLMEWLEDAGVTDADEPPVETKPRGRRKR